mmetsp:Transcript_107158/g.190389  ORF Transcript_107158/g.190389 Transcript_107158/m.190389 type:complete len:225 (-) Transcript_107158:953-1627(-)
MGPYGSLEMRLKSSKDLDVLGRTSKSSEPRGAEPSPLVWRCSKRAHATCYIQYWKRPHRRQLWRFLQASLGSRAKQHWQDDFYLRIMAAHRSLYNWVGVSHALSDVKLCSDACPCQSPRKIDRGPRWHCLVLIPMKEMDWWQHSCCLFGDSLPFFVLEEALRRAGYEISSRHVVHDPGVQAPRGKVRPKLFKMIWPRDADVTFEVAHRPNICLGSSFRFKQAVA